MSIHTSGPFGPLQATDQHAGAAEALAALLPTATVLRPTLHAGAAVPAGAAGSAVTASFVGATSADVALVMADSQALAAAAGPDSPLVSMVDVLRPALEAATASLGRGVLGEASQEDASALFSDPDTIVFELAADGAPGQAGPGVPAGWFGIRIRSNGTVNGAGAGAGGGAHPGAGHDGGGRAAGGFAADKLGRINNVEMALTVEIGHTRMSVRDVLDLEPGGVIELDRSAGAPADVLLNGRLIAHGEVVVVDQDYAVRITKILDVAEGLS